MKSVREHGEQKRYIKRFGRLDSSAL